MKEYGLQMKILNTYKCLNLQLHYLPLMMTIKKINFTSTFLWDSCFYLALLVYGVGLFVEILEPDASLYAELSREIFVSGNYWDIMLRGVDWLDKPQLQFWMTACAYHLFHNLLIGYKLPAILAVLISVWYTHQFAAQFYAAQQAKLAALILMTAQHIITSNMDVRAEPYLTLFTIMGLYHIALFLDTRKQFHLFVCSMALAALIMTKGIFTIIPIAAGVGCALLYKKEWKSIFHWQWLLCIAITLICTIPALYAYYQQFDMHPEKIVFGQQNVSGIRFFLYDSQFGRFFNNGPIKGDGDPFFFVHTLLWAFLPWAFIAYYALFQKSKQLLLRKTNTEHYTYFGFMVMFLIFSASKFQLAHYLNPIFPLLAIICADAIVKASAKAIRILTMFQVGTLVLLLLAATCLIYFFQTDMLHIDTILIMVVFIALGIFVFTQKNKIPFAKLIFMPTLIVLSINYYLNREFYPELTKYQSETAFADFYLKEQLPVDSLATLNFLEFGASFKLNTAIPAYELNNVTRKAIANKYIFTSAAGLAKIDSFHLPKKIIKTFNGFHVTMLTGEFINKSTRASVLTPSYLVKLEQ